MKFFVPDTEDTEEAEKIYEIARKNLGVPLRTGRRIYGLAWTHKDERISSRVGEPLPEYFDTGDAPVYAIFEAVNHYKICTWRRGIWSGSPVLADKDINTSVILFED
ncbi:hypothetical protein ABVF61_00350 [Roseibium sp. HPY-6]|uniref:hypothetical protein n=1 Tax=Roseibium sp. HPY-6 TaxID=3229852 RepID=UPI00338E3C48